MSIAGSQQQTLLRLLAYLRPYWRTDRNLPGRIQSLLAGNRAFGSRDRRLYRELVYTALRYLPWIEPELQTRPERAIKLISWLSADTPATARFREAFSGDWPACPIDLEAKKTIAQITSDESLLPTWFEPHCPEAFRPEEMNTLHRRAALWLRLQTQDASRLFAEFTNEGWAWAISPVLPGAVEFRAEADVTRTEAYEAGQFEIQDLGSQLLLESIGLEPGGRWLDACAGAGGKTLQLAALLGPGGAIDAYDIRSAALQELLTRAERAHLKTISIIPSLTRQDYDGVLIDAPCSGTGTWRRSPHLKWVTTPRQIEAATKLQLELLHRYAAHVRPGGRLVYATCSLSRWENEEVVGQFLNQNPGFQPVAFAQDFGAPLRGHGLTFLPSLHNTDGFFVASLRRRA